MSVGKDSILRAANADAKKTEVKVETKPAEEVKAAAAAKQPWYKQAIKTLGDIFVPIIPAIVASGFLMGIMEALNFMVNNGFLNIDTSGSIYTFAQLLKVARNSFNLFRFSIILNT